MMMNFSVELLTDETMVSLNLEGHSEISQASKMVLFAKIANGFLRHAASRLRTSTETAFRYC